MHSRETRLKQGRRWITSLFPVVAVCALAVVLLAGCGSSSVPVSTAFGGPSNHLHDMLALQGIANTVLLATHYGMYRTSDGGKTWMPVSGGTGQQMIDLMPFKLIQSPQDPKRIYVPAIPRDVPEPSGGGTPGIYMSTDAGLTWHLVTKMTTFPGGTVYSIGPGAAADELYAIVPDYSGFQPFDLYVTHDSGGHWTKLPDLPTSTPTGVMADPSHAGRLLLWSGGDGLFTSDDSGQTWNKVSDVQQGIDTLTLAGQTIYMAGDKGIYISHDDGATITLTPMQKTFITIAASKTSPQHAYVLLANGLEATSDGGKTWHATTPPARGAAGLTVDPTNGAILYVGNALPLGVEVSANSGSSWQMILP